MLDASTDFALVSDALRINNLATALSTDSDPQDTSSALSRSTYPLAAVVRLAHDFFPAGGARRATPLLQVLGVVCRALAQLTSFVRQSVARRGEGAQQAFGHRLHTGKAGTEHRTCRT